MTVIVATPFFTRLTARVLLHTSCAIARATPSAARARMVRGSALDDAAPDGRHIRQRPLGGEPTGTTDDPFVGVALGAKKAEDARNRCKPDRAVAHPLATQPLLIELDALGQFVGDRLVETGREQASDMGVYHSGDVRPGDDE